MKNFKKLNSGFAAFYSMILILGIICATTASVSFVVIKQQKGIKSMVRSFQSYYSAETGVEDALLRLKSEMEFSSPYTFNFDNNKAATVEISESIGGSRTITAEGNTFDKVRKISAVYKISSNNPTFSIGIQVGNGGLTLGNNSVVVGDIFSNGSIVVPTGTSYLNNNVIVAQKGNVIDGAVVSGDVSAYSCIDSQIILGDLTYIQGGVIDDCEVIAGDTILQLEEIPAQDMPITDEQINTWKQEATNGGIIAGDYSLSGSVEQNLGPKKITGDLILDNGTTLNLTGTILVSGNLTISNNAKIKLDSGVYGSRSGLIIITGKTKINPNVHLEGSGEDKSFLMLLSINTEVSDIANPAIRVDNNISSNAAIFYAGKGLIVLNNGALANQVTGYKVHLENNAWVVYLDELKDIFFSSEPTASWELESWKEIE